MADIDLRLDCACTPTITTSVNWLDDSDSCIEILDSCAPTVTVLVWKPTKEICNDTFPTGTESSNLPSSPEIVFLLIPLTATVAPAKGELFLASWTTPVIFRCAIPVVENNKSPRSTKPN